MTAPDLSTVFERAACLWALYNRLVLDQAWRDRPHDQREQVEQYARSLDAWRVAENLVEGASPEERALFASLVGAWREDQRLDLSWRIESLGVLTWALGLLEALPPYDTQISAEPFEALFRTLEPLAPLRARARLRRPGELLVARQDAELWDRRATRVERFYRPAVSEGRLGPRPPARTPAKVRRALGEEVTLFGKPYSALNDEEHASARSIAVERLHALRWLAEGDPWP